jgi:hypothetical protein
MIKFFVGVDLGQAKDYTAISILERPESKRPYTYHVRHLARARGEPYPEIVSRVVKMMSSPALAGNAKLIVDQTGCGRPVFDLFKAAKMRPIGVSITGGDSVSHEGRTWRTPKRDLVGVLQVLLQTGRLKVASKLELGPILQAEMLNFKVKIDPATAHDSYSAWREGDHDDLVLSVALAAWCGEAIPEPRNLIPNRVVSARRGVYPVGIY